MESEWYRGQPLEMPAAWARSGSACGGILCGLLENNMPSCMLGARYCLCPLENKMFQNTLSMNSGSLDGTSPHPPTLIMNVLANTNLL